MTQNQEKIIIVTPDHSIFTGPFQRAFEKRGFKTQVFNTRQGLVFTNKIIRKLFHRFRFLRFFKHQQVIKTNRTLLGLVNSYKPKYLFVQKGDGIYPETIREIKNQGVITINFFNDFINLWELIRRVAPAYDFFFSPDHHVLRELKNIGVTSAFYLPVAVEARGPDLAFQNRQDLYNVTFVGTYNPEVYHNREHYLIAVKDLGLHIWGNDGWASSPLKKQFHTRASGDERFDIYRASKIVIEVNFDEWPCEAMSMRPSEVGYSGACLFSDTTRADLFRAFEPYKEFVPFSDEKDLREKVKYYLEHEEERLVIAQAGHEKVMKNHTYDVRLKQMFDIIDSSLQTSKFCDNNTESL